MQGASVWFLQPLVTAFGLVVAISAIWWSRRVARLKATLDLIEGSESKEYYQTRYRAFRQFRRDAAFRDSVLHPANPPAQDDRDKCLDYLNHYELVSIACRKGIIDESFYRLWMGPSYVRDWNEAADLILAARTPKLPGDAGGKMAYCDFERLALKWGGQTLR